MFLQLSTKLNNETLQVMQKHRGIVDQRDITIYRGISALKLYFDEVKNPSKRAPCQLIVIVKFLSKISP